MKANEVIALIIGITGFLILRVIYLGEAIPSPNGLYDLRPVVFGLGIIFVAVFGFLMGWGTENDH